MLSTHSSRSKAPMSVPMTLMRGGGPTPAPSNDRLKVRVLLTFVRYSRTTSPAVTSSS